MVTPSTAKRTRQLVTETQRRLTDTRRRIETNGWLTQWSHYATALAQADDRVAAGIANGANPAAVAHAIVAAVDDPTTPARVLVGEDALARWDEFRRALIKLWQAEQVSE